MLMLFFNDTRGINNASKFIPCKRGEKMMIPPSDKMLGASIRNEWVDGDEHHSSGWKVQIFDIPNDVTEKDLDNWFKSIIIR